MFREYREIILGIASIASAIALLISTGLGIVAAVDYADCWAFESATGIETKWRLQCYAKRPDGAWVPKKYVFGNATEIRIK